MIWRKGWFHVFGAVALAWIFASSAHGVLISTAGTWDNPQGSAATLATITGEDTLEIGWGVPSPPNTMQSSYRFDGRAPFDIPIETLTPGDMLTFDMGVFTHNNFPLGAEEGKLLGADLTVEIGGFPPPPRLFGPFEFDHNETLNAEPCNPMGPGDPCPDVVLLPATPDTFQFRFMMMDFEFSLLGFQPTGGGPIIPMFITAENQANTATLFGKITKLQLPEPTTPFLLGLGLLALRIIRKRKRH